MKTLWVALMLAAVLLCGSCGNSSKSTPASMSPTSWVGTWSGQVNWTGTGSADNVTVTITAPVTSAPGSTGNCLHSTETCYTSQFTGTDSGNQCAGNGVPATLVGEIITYSGSYGQVDGISTGGAIVTVEPQNNSTCNNISYQYEWNVSASNITIVSNVSPSSNIGTLTKQ
jgi:hypothetical protein